MRRLGSSESSTTVLSPSQGQGVGRLTKLVDGSSTFRMNIHGTARLVIHHCEVLHRAIGEGCDMLRLITES